MEEIKGYIHSIETFGSVDGPGVRFIIFFSGCAMRCAFCHNPDSWDMTSGKQMTVSGLLDRASRYKSYWKNDGGITVSGGEPLLQPDFLLELFREAKKRGINTCLDTSGNPFTTEEPFYGKFLEIMKVTDLVMLDIKEIDDEDHKKLTGQTNRNILKMAETLSELGVHMWIRHVLVPGGSDDDAKLKKLRNFIDGLKTVDKVEILPYHTIGVFKWKELGLEYRLEGVVPPTPERIKNAEAILNG